MEPPHSAPAATTEQPGQPPLRRPHSLSHPLRGGYLTGLALCGEDGVLPFGWKEDDFRSQNGAHARRDPRTRHGELGQGMGMMRPPEMSGPVQSRSGLGGRIRDHK
jgi:hypothetical protein